MLKEFKEFAMRGSVLDLAIGVIIGGAFGKIIGSLVNDLLMPFIGLLMGGINLSDKALQIGEASVRWGAFLQNVIDFLIIAFVVFLIVKAANRLKKEEAPAEPAAPTTKACPYCYQEIPIQATRCPHCTSALEQASD